MKVPQENRQKKGAATTNFLNKQKLYIDSRIKTPVAACEICTEFAQRDQFV